MPATQTMSPTFAMPGFRWRLNDVEVADLLSFVRGSWGDHAAADSLDEVGSVRKKLAIQNSEKE